MFFFLFFFCFFFFLDSNAHAQSPIGATDVQFFALSFLKDPTTRLRTAKALARLRLCAVSPEPLLIAYMINTLFSCAGLYIFTFSTDLVLVS